METVNQKQVDSKDKLAYKKHCEQELKWCNEHEKEIIRLAQELHRIICNDEPFGKRKICPDYRLLEKECDKGKEILSFVGGGCR